MLKNAVQMYKSAGIVLKALPYSERSHILTLFTKEHGLLKLFVKGNSSPLHNALISPLTLGEYLYRSSKGDLFRFCEGSLLEQHLGIRDSLEALQIAEKMVEAILSSQLYEKRTPALFSMFALVLKKVEEHFPHLSTLYALFLIKILKFEGICRFDSRFSEMEKRVLHLLLEAKNTNEILFGIEEEFLFKIEELFQESLV